MIMLEYGNNTEVAVVEVGAQSFERPGWGRSFAEGGRKYRRGLSLAHCMDGIEMAGYWDAADKAASITVKEMTWTK
jgi:hypothetical protein